MEATNMGAEIVSTLTTAFTSTASAIGKGIVSIFSDVFLNGEGGLSSVGTFVLVMAGVGFAFGLAKFVTGMIRNRG